MGRRRKGRYETEMTYLRVFQLFAICLGVTLHGCATPSDLSERQHEGQCDVESFSVVFKDPLSFFGKRFCGKVIVVPTNRILPVFPIGEVPAGSRDVVAFFDPKADLSIRSKSGSSGEPFIVHIKAKVGGEASCFQPKPDSGCIPYSRPFLLYVEEFGEIEEVS
jgi:hypothetical protein